MLTFGAFSLDEEAGRLWRGDVERPLRAKSLSVLRQLVLRRGRLVTKEALFRVCWPGTAVSQTVLRVCIGEIRAALAEDGDASVVIESVGRRGYRLRTRGAGAEAPPGFLVGRRRENATLRRALRQADGGLRQVVLVSGDAGMGKTTLLDHFAEEVRAGTPARVASGQCVELTGGTEPYVPVLDLLVQLCGDDATGEVHATLVQRAPSWLLQLPSLIDAPTAEALRRRVPSPNRERMVRELRDALEAIAADRTLVLIVEDLHWSDRSSIDALTALAQRTLPARLLLIASYRPADRWPDHPSRGVVQSLVARRRAVERSPCRRSARPTSRRIWPPGSTAPRRTRRWRARCTRAAAARRCSWLRPSTSCSSAGSSPLPRVAGACASRSTASFPTACGSWPSGSSNRCRPPRAACSTPPASPARSSAWRPSPPPPGWLWWRSRTPARRWRRTASWWCRLGSPPGPTARSAASTRFGTSSIARCSRRRSLPPAAHSNIAPSPRASNRPTERARRRSPPSWRATSAPAATRTGRFATTSPRRRGRGRASPTGRSSSTCAPRWRSCHGFPPRRSGRRPSSSACWLSAAHWSRCAAVDPRRHCPSIGAPSSWPMRWRSRWRASRRAAPATPS